MSTPQGGPSNWRRAWHAEIEQRLACPRCPASNRPGATYIELSQDLQRAFCCVCSHEGPLREFQPEKETR